MSTSIKTCFKCGSAKPRSEFYAHQKMSDGLLGKCKACCKLDARKNRSRNIERIREYDRLRGMDPKRKEYVKRQSARYKPQKRHVSARYRAAYPAKRAAHDALGNAIRDGRLTRKSCLVCGEPRTQGHHFDYARPLDVIWLCTAHHAALHKIEREIDRVKEKSA